MEAGLWRMDFDFKIKNSLSVDFNLSLPWSLR